MNICQNRTDTTNCHDAVNHPICSHAEQAKVSLKKVMAYLNCVQQLTYFQCIGITIVLMAYGGMTT